jgi:hypothetical protein
LSGQNGPYLKSNASGGGRFGRLLKGQAEMESGLAAIYLNALAWLLQSHPEKRSIESQLGGVHHLGLDLSRPPYTPISIPASIPWQIGPPNFSKTQREMKDEVVRTERGALFVMPAEVRTVLGIF